MNRKKLNIYFLGAFLVLLLTLNLRSNYSVLAKDPPKAAPEPASASTEQAPSADGRSSSLNFEDEVVEGMNRNPFDSLTHVEKKDDREQSRLYKKKPHFHYEIKLTVREMGFSQ